MQDETNGTDITKEPMIQKAIEMFEAKKALFLYCISPVHMGAGTALGAIDNPIQRERHTEHPNMAGSGLKGAFRDVFSAGIDQHMTTRVFGPETDASDHAGAISFADAQLVLFPVRSLRRSFVYATCPTALGRLQRLLTMVGVKDAGSWKIPEIVDEDAAVVEASKAVSHDRVILEAYEFQAHANPDLGIIATWLAENAMPGGEGMEYFREKLKSDLVILSDERFNFFVRYATLVEAHVRINDESGTADDGGLFYTENLPPESLLVSMVMASKERFKKDNGDQEGLSAGQILEKVEGMISGKMVQVGGDATTGRGQILGSLVGGA